MVQSGTEQNMTVLTILGSATAPTVLHNLLRSHLELSLTEREGFRAVKNTVLRFNN